MAISSKREVLRLSSKDKEYSVSVAGIPGLSLRVFPNGKKEYYFRYTSLRDSSKRPRVSLGTTETTELDEAKNKAEEYLELLEQGIEPKTIASQEKIGRYGHLKNATFSDMVEAWKQHEISGRNQKKAGKRSFSESTLKFWDLCLGYMCDEIGDMHMEDIRSETILSVCEAIQNNENEAVFVGASTRLYTEKVFAFAVARGLCSRNVAIDTRGQLAPSSTGEHLPAITKPDDFAKLLKDMAEFQGARDVTLQAANMLPYVFVRSIDLRSWRWDEIDWDRRLWEFSPVKGEGREDMVSSLVVPLSDQVLDRLEYMKALTGHKEYIFSSPNSTKNRFISKATLVQFFHRLGYKGVQCAHGFRASAKTMLMEQPELRYSDTVTELQLGHNIKDTHGGAYNRLDEINTRVQMMQDWADYIDALRDS